MLVSVGDVRLFVDVDGAKLVPDESSMRERPTIVLLHGTGGDHTPLKAAYSALADVAQLVYYDHRGNGRSEDGPQERWTLDQWADDVHSLCDVLGIVRPVVFGASFGGVVAINYAARFPDHPAMLVLASTAARINVDRSVGMFERLGGQGVRQVAERFFAGPTAETREKYLRVCGPYFNTRPGPPEIAARMIRRPAVSEHFLRGEFLSFDLTSSVEQIRCPVLLLAGELDPVATVEGAEEIASALPRDRVQFVRFPDEGHGLSGAHEDVMGLIRTFVSANSAQT